MNSGAPFSHVDEYGCGVAPGVYLWPLPWERLWKTVSTPLQLFLLLSRHPGLRCQKLALLICCAQWSLSRRIATQAHLECAFQSIRGLLWKHLRGPRLSCGKESTGLSSRPRFRLPPYATQS
eukprot:1941091-Amphidinium_carterae.1